MESKHFEEKDKNENTTHFNNLMTYRDKLNKLQLAYMEQYDFYLNAGIELRRQIFLGLSELELLKQKKESLLKDFQRSYISHLTLKNHVSKKALDLDSKIGLFVLF
jgi:hypothetical protein